MDSYTLNRIKKNINTIVRGIFTYNGFKYLRLYPVTDEKLVINNFLNSILAESEEDKSDAIMDNEDNYLLLIIMDGEDQIIKLITDSEVDPILDGKFKLGTIMNNIVINNKSFLRKHD